MKARRSTYRRGRYRPLQNELECTPSVVCPLQPPFGPMPPKFVHYWKTVRPLLFRHGELEAPTALIPKYSLGPAMQCKQV